ncbi:hypothetical protein EJD97_004905 [Solanum chilense]|uniref:Uncharacterized protein n=1 Tax=Solanum chilense TaxID=4083 RepID=A0A6N2BTN5_SOLCI|nr:hypothetical protein EJD97_004905 [Solanum chilense]
MAMECGKVIGAMNFVRDVQHFDMSTFHQLEDARNNLEHAAGFLRKLEKRSPENTISTYLRPLFLEALDGLSAISSHMKDQGQKSDIAERISKVLKIIKLKNIAERIKASKPSRSSSQVTLEMVEFVKSLLVSVHHALFFISADAHVSVLVKKLWDIRGFFTFIAKQCIEHESMKDFFTHAEDVAYTAAYLCFLGLNGPMDTDIPKFLKRISPFSPDVRQIYLSVLMGLNSFRSETTMNAKYMFDFVSALRNDLEELLSNVHQSPCIRLQQGLSHLSRFLWDIKSDPFPLGELISLQSQMQAVAIEAAIAIYTSYDEKVKMKTTETDHLPLILQLKLNHVKVEVSLIKLLKSKPTVIAPLKDLIDCVREELIFMKTFFMDAFEQCKEQTNVTEFFNLIQSVTSQAWLVIYSLYRDIKKEGLAREISWSHFQLLLKFRFIRAVIGQICPRISVSSIVDHPTINLLNFLPLNFKVLDSYFSMLKSSMIDSSDSPMMDLVLMGFHEYILDNLQLKNETSLTFTNTNEVKKFYYGLLLLVTYLFDPLVQCSGFGTIEIEAAGDSNRNRRVSLVLQYLTVALKLIEPEETLMDMLTKATLKAPILDMVESAHEELIFLRAFLMDVLRQQMKLNKYHHLLRNVEETANKLAQVSRFRNERFMDENSTWEVCLILSDFLYDIKFIKVEIRKVCIQVLDASLMTLPDIKGLLNFLSNRLDTVLDCDAGSIAFLMNRSRVLKEKLMYLGHFLADVVQHYNMHQGLKDLMKHVLDTKYVCLLSVGDYKSAWYYMLSLSDMKQLLKFVEAEVKKIIPKAPESSSYSFPKTNGLGFLQFFLGNLEELLCSKLDSVIDWKDQIGSVKEGILCLRDHFAENFDELDEVYGFVLKVTEMAYKAEFVIDSCLVSSHPLWYKSHRMSEVLKNIKLLNKAVTETYERKEIDVTVHKVAKTSMNPVASLLAYTPRENEEMEGFHEAMDKIKRQLLRRSSQLDIISIVGMPGIGKTTLAEKIYNNLIVTPHFDVHAKCRVTQLYSWKELLLTILNDVLDPADRTGKEDGELATELRQVLLTKRFLILVDDVWDKTVWDHLYRCFRDAKNGSRIILTTRLSDIANYAKCKSEPHHLRLFRDDESWTLLQEEVFQGESCPTELVDVGFRIAKSCGGLPLSIVLVGGVLKEKEKKEDLWKEVEESLGSKNIGSLQKSMSLIGFSYKNLPHHLKPCFLYFGGFFKGKDIHVSKLTRLWQAEGFVQANKEKRTDTAHDFLEDLISRNLVMVMKERPNDKVKSCRIHDLLHNFCLEKSKQENFLNQMNRGEDILPEKPQDYRLFIHSYQDEIDSWRPCGSNVRSLQFKVTDPDSLLWPRDISFIFDSFKLVKVLDLESYNIGGTFPSEVESLIHLRYFAVQTYANSIPSFIAKLQNLETFVVRGLGGEVIIPSSILKMVKLRHLLVKNRASFSLQGNMGESFSNSQLDYLETFSTPRLSYGQDAEMILTKMPNLRKLNCIFLETFSYLEKLKGRCVRFPTLEFLSHLESLKLVSNCYPSKLPHVFNFPSKLRELTLSKFRLPWYEISIVGQLPNLEILRLLSRAFEGNEWEVNDSEFPELKYLNLDNINISQWSLSNDAFPKLERLVLTKCKQLEEIPSHFGDAVTLKSIEVNRCGWSVSNSALEIQTAQHEDMANDAFTVTIQPPDWARKPFA